MTTRSQSHKTLASDLIALGDLKVWSVLVTIFGDLAPNASDHLEGPLLSALTAGMGIKPEALRVALFRLRKDGWIEAEKSGRVSHYRMSAYGRQETVRAKSRVFGPFPNSKTDWLICLSAPNQSQSLPDDAILIGRDAYLTEAKPNTPNDIICATLLPGKLPEWAANAILPKTLRKSFAALEDSLARHARPNPQVNSIEALILRILILHAWRRLSLRHDPRVLTLIGSDWQGSDCRRRVFEYLDALPRPILSTLKI